MEYDYKEAMKLDHQLCFPLYAAARNVINLYTPHLRPLGLTYTRYIVLMVLWQDGGMTVGDLCRRLYLDSGTLTPLLKKMEAEGLVTRTRSSEDERVVTVALTDEGDALRDRVRDIPGRVSCCVGLDSREAAALYGLLYRILREE